MQKTGRAVIVHEAPKTCGFGAELYASLGTTRSTDTDVRASA